MRTLLKLSSLALLLKASLTLLQASGVNFDATVDGANKSLVWFANSPVDSGSGSLGIEGGSGHLHLSSVDSNSYAALTYIDPVTLADGQTLSVSITALLLDEPAQTGGGAKFVFGLLDTAESDKLADNAPNSSYTSLGGYALRGRTFSQGARNYFATAGGERSFVASLENNSGNQFPAVQGVNTTTPITLTLAITNEAGNIKLKSSDGSASQTFDASSFPSPSQFTFNTLFMSANNGVGIAVQEVIIDSGELPGTTFPATIDGQTSPLTWYASSPVEGGDGVLSLSEETNNLIISSNPSNSYSAVGYMPSVSLATGESLTFAITGKLLSSPPQGSGGSKINFGLLHTSAENQLTADAPAADYTSNGGYSIRGRTLTKSGPRNFYRTEAGAISYAASLETKGDNIFPALEPFVSDSSTTYTLTVKNQGDSMLLTSSDGSVEKTYSFPSGNNYNTFNTLFIGANSGVGIEIESVEITRTLVDDYGFIDVTAAPYSADPTGVTDSTQAFRAAIAAAYNNDINLNKAVYIPSGEYLISDSIVLKQPGEADRTTERPSHMLIGAVDRPVIKLVNNAAGFGDRDDPKPLFYLWREHHSQPGQVKENDHFNTLFRNIILDTGSGNAGAVGVRFRGAEGCALTDVKVFSSSGSDFYAGVWDLLGSGGAVTNLEVIGGRYGIYCEVAQPNPVVTSVRLIGQSDLAIAYRQWTPLTVVGFEIQKENGPVIGGTDTLYLRKPPLVRNFLATNETSANVAMIDGSIEITSGTTGDYAQSVVLHEDRNVYLENVYLKGAAKAAQNVGAGPDYDLAAGYPWRRVVQYAGGPDYAGERPRMIDGVKTADEVKADEAATNLPAQSFLSKHAWQQGFGTHDSPDVINVKTAPYNAAGDGVTDDTAAIQAAIDAAASGSGRVFIPKGKYRLTAPIQLAANTELFGIGKNICIFDGQSIPAQAEASAIIVSPDDADATCSVSGLTFHLPGSDREVGAIWWRAGSKSILRDLWNFHLSGGVGGPMKRLRITGNGGGRIYNWQCNYPTGTSDAGYRNVYIEGTDTPLFFYQLHNQHIIPRFGARFEAVDASNITIFGSKNEQETSGTDLPEERTALPLVFERCSNIRLYGYSGLSGSRINRGLINFVDSHDYQVANGGAWRVNESLGYSYVQELDAEGNVIGELKFALAPGEDDVPENIISLVKRGTPKDGTSIVVIDTESATIEHDESIPLSASVSPAAYNPSGVIWSSSDESVATVDSTGLVSAVSEGTATITATSIDSGFSDSAIITVLPPPTPLEIWSLLQGLDSNNDAPDADPNSDGFSNLEHFGFDTDPLGDGSTSHRIASGVEADGDGEYLTITIPVRLGAVFSSSPLQSGPIDEIIYRITGDDDLSGADVEVVELSQTVENALSPLGDYDGVDGPDWEYRSFRLAKSVDELSAGFITVEVFPAEQ